MTEITKDNVLQSIKDFTVEMTNVQLEALAWQPGDFDWDPSTDSADLAEEAEGDAKITGSIAMPPVYTRMFEVFDRAKAVGHFLDSNRKALQDQQLRALCKMYGAVKEHVTEVLISQCEAAQEFVEASTVWGPNKDHTRLVFIDRPHAQGLNHMMQMLAQMAGE